MAATSTNGPALNEASVYVYLYIFVYIYTVYIYCIYVLYAYGPEWLQLTGR